MYLRPQRGLAIRALAPALAVGVALALGGSELTPVAEASALTVHLPWSDLVTLLWAPVFVLPWIFQ